MSYFIKVGDTFYYLDATVSISTTYSAKLSNNPLYNNHSSSDHYITNNPTISLSGVITDIKNYGNLSNLSASQYLDGLVTARNQATPVSVKFRLDKAEDYGWFITSLNFTQNQRTSFGGYKKDLSVVQAFNVSIQLEKPQVTGSLKRAIVPAALFRGVTQEKKKSSQSVQEFSELSTDQSKANYHRDQAKKISEEIGLIIKNNITR